LRPDSETETELAGILELFRKNVAERDYQILNLFGSEADVFLTGSEEGESALGPEELKAFFKRIFSRPFAYFFEWNSYSLCQAGSVAWGYIDAAVHTEGVSRSNTMPYRITVIFQKIDGRWRIVHYHGSEPREPRASS
jgi:ketosteroid isomerase-like protein